MTTKTNWDLLTDDEQYNAESATDIAHTDTRAVVNALPPRLFRPRLPEGWRIERCDGGVAIIGTSKRKRIFMAKANFDSDLIEEEMLAHLADDLLAQEGE